MFLPSKHDARSVCYKCSLIWHAWHSCWICHELNDIDTLTVCGELSVKKEARMRSVDALVTNKRHDRVTEYVLPA